MDRDPHVPNLPIAVVGMGCRFPEAPDADAFWSLIDEGRVTFREVPPERWNHEVFFSANQRDVDKAWVNSGSFIEEFREFAAMHYGIAPRRLEVMDPQQRLLIESTRWALQDAGYERTDFDRRRTGVFFGVSVSEFKNIAQSRVHAMQLAGGDFGSPAGDQALRDAIVEMSARVAPMRAFHLSGSLTALAGATVAQTFDLGGPAYVIDSACASASVAVNDAMLHLRAGLLDHAVAGGAYINLSPDNLVAFTKIGAISPSGVCRPFDHRSDGFVQSDGVGVLILKRLDDAVRDGDRVHAVLIGSGCNNDGRGEGPMTPRFEGQVEVLKAAYADADISPSSVAYFEAHGTATSVGDPVEVRALGSVLEAAGRSEPALLGSVKGNIGHAMSAAGIAGLIKAIKVIQNRVAPPQPGFESLNPKLELDRYPLTVSQTRAPLEPVAGKPLRVAVSSFGFGGTNSHLVLEAPPAAERPEAVREAIETSIERGAPSEAVEPEALLITAATPELLGNYLETLEKYLSDGPGREISLADLAFTLNARRERERYRAVIGARTPVELFRNLRAASAALHGQPRFPAQVSPHVYLSDVGPREERKTPQVAFLFAGQGAQKVGLLEGVKRRFPVFARALETFDAHLGDRLTKALSAYLYPEQRDEAAEAELTRTEICQPAMAALGLAMGALLREAKVEPQVSLGHSLGEFVALAQAGVMGPAETVALVADRGAAMRALPLEDTGAMAAVMASRDVVKEAIRDIPGVVIANINHPRQVSISGTTAGVEAASARLREGGHDVRALDVSHAFHSPVLDGIDAEVQALLSKVHFDSPKHTVASCIAGEVHTADADRTRAVLGRHATSPVDFVRGLTQTREAGAEIYLQVGAGSTLASFARATFGRETPTLTLAPTTDDRGYELVRTLCTLGAMGVDVHLEALYAESGARVVSLPETPLERQSYWVIKDQPQPQAELNHPLPPPGEGVAVASTATASAPAPAPAVASATPAPAPAPQPQPEGEPAGTVASEPLLALFAQQAEILRAHAEVLAAQNRALLGEATPSLTAPLPSVPAPRATPTEIAAPADAAPPAGAMSPTGAISTASAAPPPPPSEPVVEEVPAPSAVDEDSVRAQVLDIIAKVSAFPKDSLRGEQRLVDELGFDSLMVADLGGAIESSFPSTGGLPPNLFGLETTVADIADHLVGQLGAAPPAAAAAAEAPAAAAAPAPKAKPSPKAPAARYRVIPRERPRVDGLPHDVSGETWLVTEDDSRLAGALGSALTERGARLVRVRFAKDGVAAPARLAFGTVNLWPEAFAEGLPQALSTAGVTLDGFIHAASLSAAAAGGEPGHPLKLLHPLASQLDVPRLAVVTALGGKLGLERSPTLSRNVLQAAALGYAKALGRERPHRVVRALDVDPRVDAGRSAKWVIEELLSPDRSPEAGFTGGQRIIPELAPVEAKADERSLGAQDVVLITGGAGEIGAQVAEWTARQKPKGVIVVGRRAADDAINGLLARLSEHGCTAAYVSADVTDAASLTAATRHVVQRIGQVSVVFHAAGIIEDAPAAKKSAESVERVVATKIRGAQAILTAFPDVRDLILFSSWAGRFGNAGQVDYSAANELLDRLAVATTGATRTVSIDWPPWTGTKMVESIPPAIRASLEQRGVTFLDPQEGLDILARIFSQNARGIELVGRNMPAREVSVVVRERFDLESHPYLADHRLNGRPVVPLASITDWIVAVARPFARGPIVIEDLNLTRGVMGDEQADLHIDGRIELDGRFSAKVEVRTPEGGVAYRASLWAPGDGEALQGIELGGAPRAAPLSLDAFYAEHTFHGPMLRGVKRLNRSTEHGISGLVRGSNPKDWWLGRERAWGADPLVLDGSFQLAGYWLHVQEGRAGFPVGFDRLTLLRPFGATVHCAVRLSELGTEGFSGDIVYTNAEGEILARLDGIRGRFAHLDADGSGTSDEAAPTSKEQNGAVASPPPAPPAEVTPVVSVPDEVWDVGRFPEVEALQQRFEMAKLVGLENPYFAVHAGTARDTSVVEGKELIHFSGYNYLGFSGRPEVVEAAQSAAAKFGTSVSASRVASGERPIHREFEEGVADHLGVEAAILYVGGHATNVTTVGHILDKDDLVVHDSLIHDSIFQGIKLSGAARRPYPHEDMEALDRILGQVRSSYRRVLIAAEGIYSMDGDICNLPRLIELKKKYRCLLLIDEAHSIGVLGHQGRGVGHHFEGVDPHDVDMWMGTLSKSFASVGGYIAGRKALIEYLKYTAPGFVYSVGLAPPNAAAALSALRLMQAEPEVVERLRHNSRFFLDKCKNLGLDTGPAMGAAVIPIIVGESMLCMRLSERLKERGINVQPIVYPAVEDASSRLRFFISALHTEDQLAYTAETVKATLDELRSSASVPNARA